MKQLLCLTPGREVRNIRIVGDFVMAASEVPVIQPLSRSYTIGYSLNHMESLIRFANLPLNRANKRSSLHSCAAVTHIVRPRSAKFTSTAGFGFAALGYLTLGCELPSERHPSQ